MFALAPTEVKYSQFICEIVHRSLERPELGVLKGHSNLNRNFHILMCPAFHTLKLDRKI